jgi:hypothetical protein
MNDVQRICAQCGMGNPVESRYCAHCGNDSQAALPAARTNLPAVIGRAALPVLVGAASLVVRAGWKLLQNRLAQSALPARSAPQRPIQQPHPEIIPPETVRSPIIPSGRAKRTIHIRSSWAINNGNGVWQQGTSEQTIEVDD